MRSLVAVAVVVVVATSIAQPAAAANPSRLLVGGSEFNLVLSRQQLLRGPALIQFHNRGEDPHDLRMKRIGRGSEIAFPELPSGELIELETRLQIGRYRLWCSLPGHAERGMRAWLRVRQRR